MDLHEIVEEEVRVSLQGLLDGTSSTFYDFHHSIPSVPDALRKANPQCYTPRLVSIGPLHHGNPCLKRMEELKLLYFKNFTCGFESINFIVNKELEIRSHYQEPIMLNSKDFSQMILLDSVFIIQLFIQKEEGNPMFTDGLWFNDLVHDMLLIENQVPIEIPLTIFDNFYNLPSSSSSVNITFSNLAKNFFRSLRWNLVQLPTIRRKTQREYDSDEFYSYEEGLELSEQPRHFVEYLRMAHFPRGRALDPASPMTENKNYDVTTVSRLLQYGVRFEVEESRRISEIQFNSYDGILAIPQVKVNEWTETLFRNLLAFEQSGHLKPRNVSDYVIFMDSLIDTPEDVKILTDAGIIQDDFQDPERVSELFNNLYKEAITEEKDFCFAEQSRELSNYRRDWWHKLKARWYNWKLILKHDYFNSPWATISFIAAVILLGLTIVQTVCSIYQAKGVKI